MRLKTMFSSLLALALPLEAAQLSIAIHPNPPILANPNSLPPTTYATLLGPTGNILSARLTRANKITFPTIPPGSHLLSFYTRDYAFNQYRLDVASSSETPTQIELVQTFRGNEWGNKGPLIGTSNTTSLSVAITPIGRKDFYQKREGFNFLGILKSPMILLAIFSAAMVFGIPYLMENMDEETKAEYEEAQKKGMLGGLGGAGGSGGANDAANALQNFDFASWMAGKPAPGSSGTGEGEARARTIR